MLPVLVKEMEDRYDLIKARQGIASGTPDELITSDVWGLPEDERPAPIVLFVDEVAELFLVATRKEEERRDEMVTQLIRLAQLGRAAGIYLEVCGQRFAAELPGLAVVGDTSGGWSRIRTPHLSLADAAATCRETAHLAPDVPALRPSRAGEGVRPPGHASADHRVTDPLPRSARPSRAKSLPHPCPELEGVAVRALPVRVDAVLVQAVIAAALSFAHLHDLALAAGQDGWKAWAYPVSVDLLLVAAWRRLRSGESKTAGWCCSSSR